MTRIETIPCRSREKKNRIDVIPKRPLDLRPGDRAKHVRDNGKHSIVIYRAGRLAHFWARLRGKQPGEVEGI